MYSGYFEEAVAAGFSLMTVFLASVSYVAASVSYVAARVSYVAASDVAVIKRLNLQVISARIQVS